MKMISYINSDRIKCWELEFKSNYLISKSFKSFKNQTYFGYIYFQIFEEVKPFNINYYKELNGKKINLFNNKQKN